MCIIKYFHFFINQLTILHDMRHNLYGIVTIMYMLKEMNRKLTLNTEDAVVNARFWHYTHILLKNLSP